MLDAKRLARLERWLITTIYLSAIGFVLLLVAVKWPRYWAYIASEQTPMTWLQSIILFGCSLLALICFTLAYAEEGMKRKAVLWLTLGGAFLYLMLDERFAMHERVRDKWLAPENIKLLPWMSAGDFILLIYAILGLVFVFQIYRVFRERRAAWFWFCAAALIALFAVSADSIDVSLMTKAEERLEQSLEEIVELTAMLTFLTSILLMLFHRLKQLHHPQ